MSLRLDKSIFRRIGFRLSLGFLILFLLSSLAIFGLLYFFLSESLRAKDREIIESRLKQVALVYRTEGVPGLRNAFSEVHSQLEGASLMVRLKGPDGKVLFYHAPQLEGAALEVQSERLSDGSLLELGKDTDDRDDVLERARGAFFLLTIPCLLIGIGAAMLFARRTLWPVRELVSTMKDIQAGNVAARVKRSLSGDELDELSEIFNRMIDRIETLIRGMRESLDFVAHDLRTPMTRIRGLAERAVHSGDSADAAEALSETVESLDQILSLLNAIMDISEAESGAMLLRPQRIDVRRLLEECADLYGVVADEQGIELAVDSPELVISADPRLKQVVANLLDNALKYSSSGTSVSLSAFEEGNQVVIQVRDQGDGIDEEDLPRIWDRLYRADRSRATRGMGLGLSLVRSIAKAHQGTVRVESELGRGSTFQVVLPRSI